MIHILSPKYLFSMFVLSLMICSANIAAEEASMEVEEGMTDEIKDVKTSQEEIEKKRSTGLLLSERIKAVSRKVFLKKGRFEVEPLIATSVNDAFFLRTMGGVRGTYHFTESWSLELGALGLIYSVPLPAVRTVRDDVNKATDDFPTWALVDLGATFSPIYGKFALFSEYAVHFDSFLNIGIGGVFDGSETNFLGDPKAIVNISPALQIGIGTRIILNRWITLRIDLKNYVFPQISKGPYFVPRKISHLPIRHLAMLNVGLGFYFPMDFDYEYEGTKVVK